MNRTGGIFSGPNALGISETGSGATCDPSNSALIRQVQTYLQANGAPNLKIDGVWQGCTASAFQKVWGRPYVTSDDIYKMTGQTCKSANTLLGGVVPGFTFASLNVCNDGSDGVGTGQGGGGGTAPPQQCPQGQGWSEWVRKCVADPFGLLTGAVPTTTDQSVPQQQQCPQGQTWVDIIKQCVPNIGVALPEGLPGVTEPTKCASGTQPNPLNPSQCIGVTGITAPTECADGQSKVGGKCVAGPAGVDPGLLTNLTDTITNLLGGGGGQATPPGGQPGQTTGGLPGVNDLVASITGALSSLLGGGANSGCAPGLTFNPMTGQCVGAGGVSVPPGFTNPNTGAPPVVDSPWGAMEYAIVGVLGIGAAAVAYYVLKPKDESTIDQEFDDEFAALLEDVAQGGEAPDYDFGGGYDVGGGFGGGASYGGGDDGYYVRNRRNRRKFRRGGRR